MLCWLYNPLAAPLWEWLGIIRHREINIIKRTHKAGEALHTSLNLPSLHPYNSGVPLICSADDIDLCAEVGLDMGKLKIVKILNFKMFHLVIVVLYYGSGISAREQPPNNMFL